MAIYIVEMKVSNIWPARSRERIYVKMTLCILGILSFNAHLLSYLGK